MICFSNSTYCQLHFMIVYKLIHYLWWLRKTEYISVAVMYKRWPSHQLYTSQCDTCWADTTSCVYTMQDVQEDNCLLFSESLSTELWTFSRYFFPSAVSHFFQCFRLLCPLFLRIEFNLIKLTQSHEGVLLCQHRIRWRGFAWTCKSTTRS